MAEGKGQEGKGCLVIIAILVLIGIVKAIAPWVHAHRNELAATVCAFAALSIGGYMLCEAWRSDRKRRIFDKAHGSQIEGVLKDVGKMKGALARFETKTKDLEKKSLQLESEARSKTVNNGGLNYAEQSRRTH